MEYYEAIIIRAFQSVLEPDSESFLRRVKRYYSKNFHVPLPDVDDLDEEHVLQAFYEEMFEAMSDDERDEFLERATETEEERAERERKESQAEGKDEEFMDNLNKEVLSGTLRGPPKETKWKPKAKPIKTKPEKKEANPPPPAEKEIHMSFDGEGNLAGEEGVPSAWLDMDPLSSTPPPRK